MIEASPGDGGPSPERFGATSAKLNDFGFKTTCCVPVGGADELARGLL
jgi:hypothetical protein